MLAKSALSLEDFGFVETHWQRTIFHQSAFSLMSASPAFIISRTDSLFHLLFPYFMVHSLELSQISIKWHEKRSCTKRMERAQEWSLHDFSCTNTLQPNTRGEQNRKYPRDFGLGLSRWTVRFIIPHTLSSGREKRVRACGKRRVIACSVILTAS